LRVGLWSSMQQVWPGHMLGHGCRLVAWLVVSPCGLCEALVQRGLLLAFTQLAVVDMTPRAGAPHLTSPPYTRLGGGLVVSSYQHAAQLPGLHGSVHTWPHVTWRPRLAEGGAHRLSSGGIGRCSCGTCCRQQGAGSSSCLGHAQLLTCCNRRAGERSTSTTTPDLVAVG
jgi:hypothetical protein